MKAKIFLFIFSVMSIFFVACTDNLKDSEIVEIVKTELQECGAPEGKTDLWFKPYGIGDLERANIVVSAGGYIQLDENKVPYVVWPDNQTMYDWLLTVASGNLIWSVNDYETNGEELTEDSILNFLHNYSESIPFEEDYKENEIIEIEEYTGSQGKVEGFQEINEDDFWFIDAKTGMIIPRKEVD